jgi:hypothetical protein
VAVPGEQVAELQRSPGAMVSKFVNTSCTLGNNTRVEAVKYVINKN